MEQKGERKMTIAELSQIETEEKVKFKLLDGGRFVIRGKPTAQEKALARIADCRDEIPRLLEERDGDTEEITERIIATNVPAWGIQRENYVRWFQARSDYYWPTPEQLDVMMAAVEPGDLIIPDFALSFSVVKPNGRVVAVNRRGEVVAPSPYTPALAQQGK
jgi:hypothetical protein